MSSSADAASAPHPPGPRDPEAFYNAQKRNRRATWRMSALSAFAAMAMGVPLTLALTPLMYAVMLLVADLINAFVVKIPREFWDNLNGLGQLGLRVADYLINQKGYVSPSEMALGVAVLLLPGMAVTFSLWLGTLAFLRRGGVGGALTTLNAREPNKGDLKELQLADVVEEMAIAAGLPSPRVMLVDSPGANAAAIGTSPADARLVISRRLLDDLSRDELQAMLAHLIASIGNGDLRVAFMVTSVFETCGLLVTLINAPFGKNARGKLWRTIRYALRRGPATDSDSAEAEAVAAMLSGSLDVEHDELNQYLDNKNKTLPKKIIGFIFLPVFFTNMCIEFTLWMFLSLILGPCMALLWRTRRYLADATAVQFSRNPDALAEALKRLSEDSTMVVSGDWASHLFVVNPKGDKTLAHLRATLPAAEEQSPERIHRIIQAWVRTAQDENEEDTPENYQRVRAAIAAAQAAAMKGDSNARFRLLGFARVVAEMQGVYTAETASGARRKQGATGLQSHSVMSFHPSLKRRLRRLERMGARYSPEAHARRSIGLTIAMTILYLIVAPLMTVAGGLLLVVMAMMIMMNLVLLGIWITVIHGIFTFFGGHA